MRRNSAIGVFSAALAALATVAFLAGGAQARPAAAGAGSGTTDSCPAAGEIVSNTTMPDLKKSVRCLIAAERAARGLPKLVRDDSLESAAKRHVKTMIDTDCLAHRCPGEVDLEKRLRRAGYFDGFTKFRFAESTGCGTTAESMVSSWMASAFDRASILDATFDDVGVAVSQDSSDRLCGAGYGTFAVVFAMRVP